jgi:hypothetical protein
MNKMFRQCVQISRELGYIMFRVYKQLNINKMFRLCRVQFNLGHRCECGNKVYSYLPPLRWLSMSLIFCDMVVNQDV